VKDSTPASPRAELSLFDSTNVIVGIIIGAGIYQMAPDIAKGVSGPWALLGLWTAGGLLSLCGALGYAELATAYPREGGDCIYLRRAYGPWAGFLFGWVQLTIVRPGDITIMAFAFATYARAVYDPFVHLCPGWSQQLFASSAVLVLTAINLMGVKQGKWTQNLLTVAKGLGLLLIVVTALVAPQQERTTASFDPIPLSLALVFVLFIYGGWNEMAYVAAEVKDARRNIVRAMVLGMGAVWLLYMLVNGAFLYTLGFEGLAASQAVATDTIATAFPVVGARLISVLVCISALGAVNGLTFAGARISYAMGVDYRFFRGLGRWDPERGIPARALLLQGLISIILILAFGSFVDTLLYMAPVVYAFYLGTNLAVVVLRFKEPQVERPYRVLGYPLTPAVFCLVCLFLIHNTLTYAWNVKRNSLIVLVSVVTLGFVLYWITEGRRGGSAKKGFEDSDANSE
jgi:amino acid transporter